MALIVPNTIEGYIICPVCNEICEINASIMITKPYGIFELTDNYDFTQESVQKSLDALLDCINQAVQGEKDGVWSWDEVINQIRCYIIIMKSESRREVR
jgi:hypothetical protein